MRDVAGALGQRREHRVTVRDRFVAGDFKRSGDRLRGAYDLFRHAWILACESAHPRLSAFSVVSVPSVLKVFQEFTQRPRGAQRNSRLILFGRAARKISVERVKAMNARKIVSIAIFGVIFWASSGNLAAQQKQTQKPAGDPAQSQDKSGMDHDMPGMNMGHDMQGMKMGQTTDDGDHQAENGAVNAMSHMHHHQMGPHMYMTALRSSTPQDWAKADTIAQELREAIEKYKDYHVALSEGFRIFMPNLPQAEYHFTSYENAFLESFTFDPARPTSLLYKKTKNGYDLIGAMYTMPKRVTEEQLNERVPLSIAQWHLHVKLCRPSKELRGHADLTKFGLQGSIASKEACDEAGGTFYPVIFGWMVHVYPFEDSREKIWGQ